MSKGLVEELEECLHAMQTREYPDTDETLIKTIRVLASWSFLHDDSRTEAIIAAYREKVRPERGTI